MAYNAEQLSNLARHRREVANELEGFQKRLILCGETLPGGSRLYEHVVHGAARRVSTLRTTTEAVFSHFHPNATKALEQGQLAAVTIALHAFLINLCGLFDNLAWAFVLRHELEKEVGGFKNIGLFNKRTMQHFPKMLSDYFTSQSIAGWQKDYLTNYRDSLAHRIPPYVPPHLVIDTEADHWRLLYEQAGEALKSGEHDRYEALEGERRSLERPCFFYLHSISGQPMRVHFHSQLVADSRTAAAIGNMFLDHWDTQRSDQLPQTPTAS